MVAPLKLSRKIMGGMFYVQVWTKDVEHFSPLVEEGLDLLEALEAKLTDFKQSPFNEINYCAGRHPVKVDDEIFSLVQKAQEFSLQTNGAFDISYASVGHLWRKARQDGVLPDEKTLAEHAAWVDHKKIVMDEKEKTIFLPYPKMRIGLGGIGKGHAVDQLYNFLLKKGLVNFMVDGSGDVRVHSEANAPRPWRLGIRNPFAEDREKKMGHVFLRLGAIATSGDYVNYIKNPELERKYHHVIDPFSGRPTMGIVSSTIIAETAMEADLNATLLMILGPLKGLHYLNQNELAGIMVKSDGSVLMSNKAMNLMGEESK